MGRGKEDMEERVKAKFDIMMSARNTPALLRAPEHPPPWLDKESAKRGRDLYFQTNAAIMLSSVEALLMGMCIPNFYQPLVFSRESHGKDLAKKRYEDTASIVYSWYLGDCWERESITSSTIRKVNAMHRFIAGKVRPIGLDRMPEKVNQIFKEEEIDTEALLSYQDRVLLDSVRELRQTVKIPQEFWDYVNDSCLFSQMDMTLVQGAFFGQFLIFPEEYGASWVSKDQVEDFLHLWRANGWYLGVREENNAVLETFEETRCMGKMILEKILKPCMLYLSPNSIHMSKSAVILPGMDYHVVAYSNYELVGFPLPKLWATFSPWQVTQYYVRKVYQRHIYPLPGVRQMANWASDTYVSQLLKGYQARGHGKAERKHK